MRELLLLLLALPFALLFVLSNRLQDFQFAPLPQLAPLTVPAPLPQPPVVPVVSVPAQGIVSDVQRYLLAVEAGFSGEEAILAVALSIAEDGSGNPAALSLPNDNGTRDLGLWQINSGWWPQFGGQVALTDPLNNARAAFYIRQRQGFCAWSTYLASCGRGHNSAFAAFMGRAQLAARGNP